QLVLQFDVCEQQLVVIALRKPARLPGLRVSTPKSVRMNFLSHRISKTTSLRSSVLSRQLFVGQRSTGLEPTTDDSVSISLQQSSFSYRPFSSSPVSCPQPSTAP